MVNTQPYRVLSAPLMVQTDVKRSKFLAYVAPTQGKEAAKAFIQLIKKKHPDASHNCSAFVAGRPENTVDIGYSDDGEPSGCAGRPMLNVLQGSGIGEITVVVTRYFGGTKLGTGGMARAYGAAVSAALEQVETKEQSVCQIVNFECDYQWTSTIETIVKSHNAEIVGANYGETVSYCVDVDMRQINNFKNTVFQRTNGQVSICLE